MYVYMRLNACAYIYMHTHTLPFMYISMKYLSFNPYEVMDGIHMMHISFNASYLKQWMACIIASV